ncbi:MULTISPECIES: NADPH-dependent FMN reductase [Micrococcaceae]|uniref:NAD(P)H-dependent FMN reductase n=2 Tax=Micrococcaceae TaxID=1268 RepID=A0AAJ1SUR3_9MICC|nr:NAD(P)H-dependent oxidoreductase [Pseudarthrobacter niigatensis]MDQ0144738.1 NAD(P)H-dependent FMN reductase [Pseudarthrobacter niigatensis]MDQ0265385.1 NAD(P)H-dependent FMN reductase [Pseudarthrobacter niigatensis]
MTKIHVIMGTTRTGRFGERVAPWVMQRLAEHGLDVELLDLRDYPLPFFDQKPPSVTGRNYPTEDMARLGRKLDEADGFVVLTGEYNHGYPAVLKNAIDHTFLEWQRKPVAFVGWGGVGGARVIEQLRMVAVELDMAPIRQAVHILPDVIRPAFRSNDPADFSVFEPLEGRLTALAEGLAWWATTLAAGRTAAD